MYQGRAGCGSRGVVEPVLRALPYGFRRIKTLAAGSANAIHAAHDAGSARYRRRIKRPPPPPPPPPQRIAQRR